MFRSKTKNRAMYEMVAPTRRQVKTKMAGWRLKRGKEGFDTEDLMNDVPVEYCAMLRIQLSAL